MSAVDNLPMMQANLCDTIHRRLRSQANDRTGIIPSHTWLQPAQKSWLTTLLDGEH